MRRHSTYLLAIALVALVQIDPAARAEGASDWVETEFADSRLVALEKTVSAGAERVYLGWQISMPADWKTYWRSPGDAGKPPRISVLSASNVESVELLFPAPSRFELFNILTIGYSDEALLPLAVNLEMPGEAIDLTIEVEFMVCKDICVPIRAEHSLRLEKAQFADERTEYAEALLQKMAEVPLPMGHDRAIVDITSVDVTGPAGYQNLIVTVSGRKSLSGANIFVEGAAGYQFDMPRKTLLADGRDAVFVVPVGSWDTMPDVRETSVTLTVLDGWGGAIEGSFDLAPVDSE